MKRSRGRGGGGRDGEKKTQVRHGHFFIKLFYIGRYIHAHTYILCVCVCKYINTYHSKNIYFSNVIFREKTQHVSVIYICVCTVGKHDSADVREFHSQNI